MWVQNSTAEQLPLLCQKWSCTLSIVLHAYPIDYMCGLVELEVGMQFVQGCAAILAHGYDLLGACTCAGDCKLSLKISGQGHALGS